MSCWKVERFVQRIVLESTPEVNWIRSAVASERHSDGAGPWVASSFAAAWSSALQSASLHVASTPAPQ